VSSRRNAFILNTAEISGADFLSGLNVARPEAVLDFRPVPRFNFGGVTRALVLRRRSAQPRVRGGGNHARVQEYQAAEILILFDASRLAELSAQKLPKLRGPGPSGRWRVELLGCPRDAGSRLSTLRSWLSGRRMKLAFGRVATTVGLDSW
jgi:hypothetical protein